MYPRENLTEQLAERNDGFSDISRTEFTSTRRSRADTMPTSTLSPFFSMGNYNSISNVAQQRPNHNRDEVTPMADMYHSSDMSSPLDENATSSIASTLASLGLNEDDTRNKTSYFEHTLTRHRSFTVSSQMIENQHHNRDMMSFNPFTPKPAADPSAAVNDSTMRRRPRAISLGVADSLDHQQPISFSPFEQQRDTNVDLTDNYQTPRTLFTHMDSYEDSEMVN